MKFPMHMIPPPEDRISIPTWYSQNVTTFCKSSRDALVYVATGTSTWHEISITNNANKVEIAFSQRGQASFDHKMQIGTLYKLDTYSALQMAWLLIKAVKNNITSGFSRPTVHEFYALFYDKRLGAPDAESNTKST